MPGCCLYWPLIACSNGAVVTCSVRASTERDFRLPVFSDRTGRNHLYIHVPKTGGSAIEIFLEKSGYAGSYIDRSGPGSLNPIRLCSPQHMHAAMLCAIFDIASFDSIFMTVRHPIARIVSEYRMQLNLKGQLPPFGEWARGILRQYHRDPFTLDNHIRPQAEFWLPGSRVFRLEDGLGADFVERLEVLLHTKFSQRIVDPAMRFADTQNVNVSIDPELQAMLTAFYAEDFRLFCY